MTKDELRAYRAQFKKGARFRVIAEGAEIEGLQPIVGGQQGVRIPLHVGDILTCDGPPLMQAFGDGVPSLRWLDADGEPICNDPVFYPHIGGVWDGMYPRPGFLEAAE